MPTVAPARRGDAVLTARSSPLLMLNGWAGADQDCLQGARRPSSPACVSPHACLGQGHWQDGSEAELKHSFKDSDKGICHFGLKHSSSEEIQGGGSHHLSRSFSERLAAQATSSVSRASHKPNRKQGVCAARVERGQPHWCPPGSGPSAGGKLRASSHDSVWGLKDLLSPLYGLFCGCTQGDTPFRQLLQLDVCV